MSDYSSGAETTAHPQKEAKGEQADIDNNKDTPSKDRTQNISEQDSIMDSSEGEEINRRKKKEKKCEIGEVKVDYAGLTSVINGVESTNNVRTLSKGETTGVDISKKQYHSDDSHDDPSDKSDRSSSATSKDSESSDLHKKHFKEDQQQSSLPLLSSPRKKKRRSSSTGSEYGARGEHKKKKKKSKRKKDKEKKKKERRERRHIDKYRSRHQSSSEEESDDDGETDIDDWSAGDEGVDYGEPEFLSEDSAQWDCRSNQLYDSDNPECPLNAYHIESKPRLVQIEDYNDDGQQVLLQLDCLEIPDESQQRLNKQQNWRLNLHKKQDRERIEIIDHHSFQRYQGFSAQGSISDQTSLKRIHLHNLLAMDFIRGVIKSVTCPICQEMVHNPVIYKTCVHRFCSNCIETYNRQGKKECPLCRVHIANRRQLRPDKNISALLSHLTDIFKKLQRQEELENMEVRRKVIQEQKKLKVQKDKQKRIVYNEMKRKYSETQEERLARLARERGAPGRRRGAIGGGEVQVDPNVVMRLLEEKRQNIKHIMPTLDVEVILKHDADQSRVIQGVFIKRLRLVTSRQISLVHLAILISTKNHLREDEWPNFEFYPCLQTNKIHQDRVKKLFLNGQIRPFAFRHKIVDILEAFCPGEEAKSMKVELIYKKKPLPQITTRNNTCKGPLMGGPMGAMPMGGPMHMGGPMPMQGMPMGGPMPFQVMAGFQGQQPGGFQVQQPGTFPGQFGNQPAPLNPPGLIPSALSGNPLIPASLTTPPAPIAQSSVIKNEQD